MRNHQQFNRIIQIVATILATMVPTSMVKAVNTQIQTDHTLSGIAELSVNAPGTNHIYTLSEINGKISGHNLFYSFSDFNIAATDTAWFKLNNSDLSNVISRVTGGFETLIAGQLKMTNADTAPSFYFINPAGITFGAGASVDVPGSFYTSTASKLNFSDGSQYPVNETRTSTLSSATPESFGFLGNETGSINIGSSTTAPTTLEFKPGTNVAFAANQILIDNAIVTNEDISQAGINLQLTATGNEVSIIKPDVFADQLPAGDMTIQNSLVKTSGNGSGYLAIQSGNFAAINSSLFSDNTGNISMTEAHGIDVFVQSSLNIDNATISSSALSEGNVGFVNIVADSLTLTHGALIDSSTFSGGTAGQVIVQARQIDINGQESKFITGITSNAEKDSSGNAGNVFVVGLDSDVGKGTYTDVETLNITSGGIIDTSTSGAGNAGQVTVQARQINIDGQEGTSRTRISSSAKEGSRGNANNILVVADSLTLTHGASIDSSTSDVGNAGQVVVQARHIDINGQKGEFLTGISSSAEKNSSGSAGNVFVVGLGSDLEKTKYTDVETLDIINGGTIITSTFGVGHAGQVIVQAKQINIDGQEGTSRTGISSTAEEGSSGNAGNIFVAADSLTLANTGVITSSTSGVGNAGQVVVQAKQINIDGQEGEFRTGISSTAEKNSSGSAGNVFVVGLGSDLEKTKYTDVETLNIINGGTISNSTSGIGDAGYIFIQARQINIDGNGSESLTGISSNAKNDSSGNAGNIEINFQDSLFLDSSIISTSANTGKGGNITINGGDIISLHNAQITTSVLQPSGNNGGNITIKDTNYLLMNTGFIQANTEGAAASAGKIAIDVVALVPSNETLISDEKNIIPFAKDSMINVIQTAAPNGLSGSTSFTPPQLNLSGLLTNLVIEDFDSRTLNRNMCTVEEGSSLLPSGKGGMRLRAKDFLF